MTRLLAPLLLLALVLVGCGETPGDVLPEPRDGRSGLQLSGQTADRQIAVNDGLPTLNAGDCDVPAGPDRDLCVLTEQIDGDLFLLIIENPDALVEGERVEVADVSCGVDCDEVEGELVVDVQIGDGPRVRATGGQVTTEVLVPSSRYRGDVDLRLPGGGSLSGTFDLVPRPDEIS